MSAADLDTFLTQCDVFLPSEAEIRVLAPGEEVLPALSRLAHQGRAIVVGKLGSRGSVVVAPDHEPIEVPPYPVSAPDPTGAGDAYAGGFMAGFAATGDPAVAACCATVSASFAVEDFGPYRLLAATAAEARKRLQHVASGVPAVTEINRLATFLEHHA
jgi:ribokinase